MERFYWLGEDRDAALAYGGIVSAAHRWRLPGLMTCPSCSKTWSSTGHYFPGVDLMRLGEAEREFRKARPEPFTEFTRLRELVVPLAPPGAELPPGTNFGPLVGTFRGKVPDFSWNIDVLMAHRNVLDGLQDGGVRGLEAFPTELRCRQQAPPDLVELQLAHRGHLHPDCIPDDVAPPCTQCGWYGLKLPEEPILDGSSLPSDLDLFRVANFATMVICTERFLDAVSRQEGDGLTWHELRVRTGRQEEGATALAEDATPLP